MSEWIDTSLFYGPWPFRATPNRTPQQLKEYLVTRGVTQAWVASAPAILYPDPMQGNEPLLEAVGSDPFYVNVAVIDVTLASWERDLLRCLSSYGCRAVKLFPNYHGYKLNDPRVLDLIAACVDHNLPICVQVRMMDERGHHPLMKVPGVAVGSIVELAKEMPQARLLVCGAYQGELLTLKGAPNLWAEISFVESGHALRNAVASLSADRLVFGSHTPLFAFEAIASKLDVPDDDVERAEVARIRSENARILLG